MTERDFELLKKSFQPLSEGVLIISSVDFTILHSNPKLETILGYEKKELLGKNLDSFLPISHDIYDLSGVLNENEYLTKISWQTETKDGESIDIDFTIQLMKFDDFESPLIILYIQDTTERKMMDRTIHFTQNLLRAIREIKQSIFLNQDPSDIMETVCESLRKARNFDIVWGVIFEDENDSANNSETQKSHSIYSSCKDCSICRSSIKGIESTYNRCDLSFPINNVSNDAFSLMFFHSSRIDNSFHKYYNLFSSTDSVEALCFQISWNGRIFGAIELIYFKNYPFASDDIHILQELGNDLGFAFYNKQTEEIKTEALRKIEYQGILLDTIDIPILSIYRNGIVQYANSAAESRLGYSLTEMLSMDIQVLINLTKTTMDFIKTRTVHREIVISNDRTSVFPAMFHSSPIMGRNNEFLGIMVVIFDITEQKEQEIANRNMDRMLIESAKFASIGELAAGIAHEINNPLQSSLLYIEDLIQEDEEDPQERKKILQIVESANLRIKTLVKNLLDLGRSPNSEKEWVAPEFLVDRVLNLLEANCRKFKIQLIKEYEPNLPKIYVRWQGIEQVIINCTINSINAIAEMKNPPAEPRIQIVVSKKPFYGKDSVVFSITDNGPGIDKRVLDKLFLPLFTTRKEKNGTGLGLAISKKIIDSYDGTIQFLPDFENGSRIEFNIPLE